MNTARGRAAARPRALFAMQPGLQHSLFDDPMLARLRRILDIDTELAVDDLAALDPEVLGAVEVLITGWGAPVMDAANLDSMPHLRAIFHAAGTVKGHLTEAVWDRDILVTTAAAANALPVAEYALAMILLAGKGALGFIRDYRDHADVPGPVGPDGVGNYRRTVGIIGASTIGRLVINLLQAFDFDILLYDPVVEPGDPVLGLVEHVELHELFRRSSVVSVHAPLLPETLGMVGRAELALLPDGATLINTARAPIVDQDAVLEATRAGRLTAVLDVTDPEPLPLEHPLRADPRIVITPHIAGALGNELLRLGESAVREAELYVGGTRPIYRVHRSDLIAMA